MGLYQKFRAIVPSGLSQWCDDAEESHFEDAKSQARENVGNKDRIDPVPLKGEDQQRGNQNAHEPEWHQYREKRFGMRPERHTTRKNTGSSLRQLT